MAVVGNARLRQDSPTTNLLASNNNTNMGNTRPASSIQPTVIGPIRRFASVRRLEWMFFIICSVALLACVGVTIERIITLGIIDNCEMNKVDVTLALVLLVNTLFCWFYAFRGVFGERPFELVALTCAFLIVTAYCIENYVLVPNIFKLVRLCIIAVASVITIPLAIHLALQYNRSGALIFRTLGSASARLQGLLRQRFACESLLTFDLQMAVSMVILILRSYTPQTTPRLACTNKYQSQPQLSINNSTLPIDMVAAAAVFAPPMQLSNVELIVLGSGLLLSIVWTVIGVAALRYESRWLSVVLLLLAPVEPAYVVYKVVDAFVHRSTIDWTILAVAVISFGTLSLLNRLALLVQFLCCYKNFGQGLRERLDQQRRGGGFSNNSASSVASRERNQSADDNISAGSAATAAVAASAASADDNHMAAYLCDVFDDSGQIGASNVFGGSSSTTVVDGSGSRGLGQLTALAQPAVVVVRPSTTTTSAAVASSNRVNQGRNYYDNYECSSESSSST